MCVHCITKIGMKLDSFQNDLKKELLKNFTTFDCIEVIDGEYQKYLINKYNTEWKNIHPFGEQKYIDMCMLPTIYL